MKAIDTLEHNIFLMPVRYKYSLAALLIISLITGLSSGWNLFLINKGLQESGGKNILFVLFLFSCAGILLMRHSQKVLSNGISVNVTNDLRLYLFKLIDCGKYDHFLVKGKAEVMTILVSDVHIISQFIMSFNGIVTNIEFVVGGMVVLILNVGLMIFSSC